MYKYMDKYLCVCIYIYIYIIRIHKFLDFQLCILLKIFKYIFIDINGCCHMVIYVHKTGI